MRNFFSRAICWLRGYHRPEWDYRRRPLQARLGICTRCGKMPATPVPLVAYQARHRGRKPDFTICVQCGGPNDPTPDEVGGVPTICDSCAEQNQHGKIPRVLSLTPSQADAIVESIKRRVRAVDRGDAVGPLVINASELS